MCCRVSKSLRVRAAVVWLKLPALNRLGTLCLRLIAGLGFRRLQLRLLPLGDACRHFRALRQNLLCGRTHGRGVSRLNEVLFLEHPDVDGGKVADALDGRVPPEVFAVKPLQQEHNACRVPRPNLLHQLTLGEGNHIRLRVLANLVKLGMPLDVIQQRVVVAPDFLGKHIHGHELVQALRNHLVVAFAQLVVVVRQFPPRLLLFLGLTHRVSSIAGVGQFVIPAELPRIISRRTRRRQPQGRVVRSGRRMTQPENGTQEGGFWLLLRWVGGWHHFREVAEMRLAVGWSVRSNGSRLPRAYAHARTHLRARARV